MKYIYENISSLPCPVGEFTVCNGIQKIPFSIRKNDYNVPYDNITTETNYALDIDTKCLEIGKQYNVVFSEGGLNYCGSDEHTESITNTIDNWSVGIGSYDMNEDEDNPKNYKGYDVWRSEDNLGFSFVLLDRTRDKITFLVAWIENKEVPNVDYESVLDFWLT
ncbi:MAG: hypothetical protein E7634_04950 [Ruminococcaceae bacterium]|nr:hypothetical protein [Oscillospiraceae bacterium]